MKNELRKRIILFLGNDSYKKNKANDQEISNAEKKLNISLNSEYKEFIKEFGGCYLGYDIYAFKNERGLEKRSFVDLTLDFKNQGVPLNANQYIISFDGSGNPIVQNTNGKVLIFDHDIGEFEILAESLEDLIEKNLLD